MRVRRQQRLRKCVSRGRSYEESKTSKHYKNKSSKANSGDETVWHPKHSCKRETSFYATTTTTRARTKTSHGLNLASSTGPWTGSMNTRETTRNPPCG